MTMAKLAAKITKRVDSTSSSRRIASSENGSRPAATVATRLANNSATVQRNVPTPGSRIRRRSR